MANPLFKISMGLNKDLPSGKVPGQVYVTTDQKKMHIDIDGDTRIALNAAEADKLTTARSVQVNLASTSSSSFDGTAGINPGVTGVLKVGNGGTGASDHVANRLVWSESANKIRANSHYANGTRIGINYASEPSTNFYVNGTSAFNGDVSLDVDNNDRYLTFNYTGGTGYNWRIGYLGTGAGEENYLVFQSNKEDGAAYQNALRFGLTSLDAAFGGNVYPLEDNTKTLGTSTNKWNNVYATTFTGNATSATKLATARTINGMSFNGTAAINNYGVCDTAADTAAKTVTVGSTFSLVTGAQVTVKFTNANSVASPTLSVNGTTAKPIYRYGTTAVSTGTTTSGWRAGAVIHFTYDGTGWVRDFWENSTYYTDNVQCTTAAGTAAKTGSCSYYTLADNRYFMCMIANSNTYAGAITLNINSAGAKPIYINGSASSASNYTLPRGMYLVYYNGTNYYFRTDSYIQGNLKGNADGWNTARNINGMSINGTANRFNYGTCSTAAATVEKAVACTGYSLATGSEITVKFTVTNTAASPTLNVNSTGAKAIYYRGSAISAGYLAANRTYTFRYNGTQYELVGDVNTNSDTKVTTAANTSSTKSYVTTCTGATTGTLTYHTGVYVNHSTGVLYGAAWNDYAEYRICNEKFIPGQVVLEVGNDTMRISSSRLQRGCSIVSDTFGFAIGETDEAKCPIAVSGRVLAYGYESREEFKKHIGWPVCSGPNGTVSIMTEEEEEKYPSRIIGTISAVPDYETWGADNVEVNNRIWIKIK